MIMEFKKYHIYFLLILIIAVGILVFFIFQPFLTAILTAAILAVVFRRPYGFFLRILHNYKAVASLSLTGWETVRILTRSLWISRLLTYFGTFLSGPLSARG